MEKDGGGLGGRVRRRRVGRLGVEGGARGGMDGGGGGRRAR